MKKLIIFFAVMMFLVQSGDAVSSTLKNSYAPRETMIGEFTQDILAQINREQVRLVRDGHVDVATQFDVGKLGNKQFIWMTAPTNPGNYTLIIKDVVAFIDGAPEITEYKKDFSVEGNGAAFSIFPAFISTDRDFRLTANAYITTSAAVSFPEAREITLYPGTNYIDFSIRNILGVQEILINVGPYQIPAYISGAPYICGDGIISSGEVCDGPNLNGKSCSDIGEFDGGELSCMSNCLAFNTQKCSVINVSENSCNANRLELCTNESACVSASGFWYNNTCNAYELGAKCDSEHLKICSTAGTCLDAKGFWYNDTCNDEEEGVCGDKKIGFGEECDGTELGGMNCSALGYSKGELSCNPKESENECQFNVSNCYTVGTKPPQFRIEPAGIKSTVLITKEIPAYTFRVWNRGEEEITNLKLDYSPSKFIIFPTGEVNIRVNESILFNVTVKESWRGAPFRGVVVAYSGDYAEYLLFELNFTTNEADTITEYNRNNTANGPSYYCSELSGLVCGSQETCNGNVVATIDSSQCCVGVCGGESGWDGAWMGYLIAGILILVGVFLYMRYRKAGKSKSSPLTTRANALQKNIP